MRITELWRKVTAAALLAVAPHMLFAQQYPTKPIRLIIPYQGGAGGDILGRELAQELSKKLGQPVVVENKPGASLIIGTQAAAKADPDGYTLLLGTVTSFALNAGVFKKLPYDPIKDFAPISLFYRTPLYFDINANLPFKTLQEFVAFAKANPGKMTFGSIGPGSSSHLVGELLKVKAGIDLVHVPYKDTYAIDLIAGRIDSVFDPGNTSIPRIKKGQIRALAVTGAKRLPATPDVPTVTETGVSGFDEVVAWVGIFAPAGTSAEIINRLSKEINEISATPAMINRHKEEGIDVQGSTPQELDSLVRNDLKKWGALQKQVGVQLQ